MGNCLKSPTSDDISLLHESQSDRASFGDGTDPDLEPPPPYQGHHHAETDKDSPCFTSLLIACEYVSEHLRGTLDFIYGATLPFTKFMEWCFSTEQIHVPVYHPTPSQTRLATQLTEEEQVRIAQRIGLIQHLPRGVFDPGSDGTEKKIRECVICMLDFVYGDPIRFLPCMHIYHMDCIDDWLMRSFTCPSCMEPVDAALLSSYETN
ncbi:hypothetical protein QTP86_032360 [Hemibagrus guttatus]|nr:hypothetical protein QTP86_032360 [Hemibagrus guttatus]